MRNSFLAIMLKSKNSTGKNEKNLNINDDTNMEEGITNVNIRAQN
jgi:hypothetical protein